MRYLENNVPVVNALDGFSTSDVAAGGVNSSAYDEDRRYLGNYLYEHGIRFEGRALPVEIHPYLIESGEEAVIREKFTRFHSLMEKVVDLYVENQDVRDYLAFSKSIEDLILLRYPYFPRIHVCRFDFTFDKDRNPIIYENNSECPSGLLLMKKIFAGYRNTKLFRDLCSIKDIEVSPFKYFLEPVFSESLLNIYNAVRREASSRPVVAILNSRHNTLTNELALMAEELSVIGCETVSMYVEDLVYDGSRLIGKNRMIDLCYQKFDSNPAWEYPFTLNRRDADNYLRALTERRVIGVNSFASSYLIESKAVLALLWEKEFEHYFSSEELGLGRAMTATTKIAMRLTDSEAKAYKHEKDLFILKKSFDTRGRSVLLGKNVQQEVWSKALDSARTDKNSMYVVQKYQEHEVCPDITGIDKYISHAYFVVGGKPVGMLTRVSADPITNVGRNGSLGIPLMVAKVVRGTVS